MAKLDKLNLTIRQANGYIRDLMSEISKSFDIEVSMTDDLNIGEAKVWDNVDGDFSIEVNTNMRTNGGLFKTVDDFDFLNVIRALYHERQHVVQNCQRYLDLNPEEDTIMMSLRKLAIGENARYYTGKNRYLNDLSEIEAEVIALGNTYDFIRREFSDKDADKLICNFVENRIKIGDYFISESHSSFKEIAADFVQRYKNAQEANVTDYIAYVLRPSQTINPKEDVCIKYLQSCVRENPNDMELLTKFNSASKLCDRDMLIASIMCHLHPEIEYERIYPCLRHVDLSPENVFERELPKVSQTVSQPIPKRHIDERIKLAHAIHGSIPKHKDTQGYTAIQQLNESLLSEHGHNKSDRYDFA